MVISAHAPALSPTGQQTQPPPSRARGSGVQVPGHRDDPTGRARPLPDAHQLFTKDKKEQPVNAEKMRILAGK